MADKKISELINATSINSDAVFPLSQQVSGDEATVKGTINQIGDYVAKEQTHSTLNTTSKKLIGAINELAAGGGGGGGSSHDYSTTEHIVGTWIDGSPVYEKTFNPTVTAADQTFAHGISNLGVVVDIYGSCTYNNQSEWVCLPYTATSYTYCIALGNVTSTTFRIQRGSGFSSLQNVFVTIRYTKSS